MVRIILENLIPARAHIKEQPGDFDRFKALWTPTQIVLDPNGDEHHRIEGFLPVEDFLAQVELGLAKLAFNQKKFGEAERRFRSVCERHPKAGAAPEACYWAGVAAYKSTNQQDVLRETARILAERYPESEWSRKAMVWSG